MKLPVLLSPSRARMCHQVRSVRCISSHSSLKCPSPAGFDLRQGEAECVQLPRSRGRRKLGVLEANQFSEMLTYVNTLEGRRRWRERNMHMLAYEMGDKEWARKIKRLKEDTISEAGWEKERQQRHLEITKIELMNDRLK